MTAKKKSLTIHIDTPLIGPHGMPLVHGSTPSHTGSIRGTVRFSSNYDCKGRDIQIIYEAWSETRGTAMENKKLVHHHTKKTLGYQTWTFPLVHTKNHGSRVVGGNYEQDFEAFFLPPSTSTPSSPSSSSSPSNSSSTRTSCDSISSTPTSSSIHSNCHLRTPPTLSSSASSIRSASSISSSSSFSSTCTSSSILPSSSTNPNRTIKYTIRAILQRPFPSLSNVEACQEVWVVHSNGTGVPYSHSLTKRAATAPSSPTQIESTSSAVNEQTALSNADSTVSSEPFMSTPASKIASEWSATSTAAASIASRKTTMAPMPSTPFGRNQLVVFLYYFCTIVLGLGFCKHYSEVIAPSTTGSSSTTSS
ncbi:hypothetical protein BGZ95_012040 [Linnemannia exigua]|uniref:Uncharacterized protein n=1 Tax=Linnemannia exigua TaxID=604196 RepID=A0AAD4D9M2_9FUNG|nr:hypothetical protein BGZ95_012040 [Linnemannia exigua]